MIRLRLAIAAAAFATLSMVSTTVIAEVREHKFRMAFQTSRESYMGIGAQAFADALRTKSGGKMTVQLFPDGTLGGDVQTISAVRGATLDATGLSAGLLVGLVKEFGLFDLPFLFENDEEAIAVVNGPFGRRLSRLLIEKDLVALGYWGLDFRNLTNNRRPVTKLEDIKGLKIRVLQSPVFVDLWNTLGANAVAMPFPEVYTALEQGTVDGQENPYAAIASAKLNEVQKYLSLTRHVYFVAAAVFSKRVWDRLNDDERRLLQEAAQDALPRWQEAAFKDREALAARFKVSMKVNELSPEEYKRLRDAARPVVDRYVKTVDPEAVNELFAEIEKVRAGRK
jgi:tripartite ATP-independent transporter DctP family solute receptor